MTENPPVISVLMAVYNTPPIYLDASIQSILGQSFDNFEFIIVNDGSNAQTRKILEFAASKDGRVKVYHLPDNVGLTKALNKGLSLVAGSYVARHDADDVSLCDRFYSTLNFMDRNPHFSAVGTCADIINEDGVRIGSLASSLKELKRRNVLVHGSMMFRKDALQRIGGYDDRMRLSQDYEVYLRMVTRFGMRIGVVPERLYALRQHSQSISSRRLFRQFYFSVLAKCLNRPSRGRVYNALVFLRVFAVDFVFTHHLLLGPIVRRAWTLVRHRESKVTNRK